MTTLDELLAHLMTCPMGSYDLKADDRAWLHRMAELTVAATRAGAPDGEPLETPHPHDATCSRCRSRLVFSARRRGDGLCNPCSRKMGAVADRAEFLAGASASGTQLLADRCRAAGIEPSLVQELVLEILASPEGRAAIAECMRRPPVRMHDGTWREPTPGSEAKAGDVVRCPATGRGGRVYRIDGECLWLHAEGGGYETMRTPDVEVIVPAEAVPGTRYPLTRERQGEALRHAGPKRSAP